MSGSTIADNPLCDFRDFVVSTSTEVVRKSWGIEPTCLADYIRAWVITGDGVRRCLGDFQVFLVAMVAIIDGWTKDPRLLDYVTDDDVIVERRAETIFGELGLKHDILDPHFFATWRFHKLHSM